MGSWNTIYDAGSLQYAAWRAITGAVVRPPTVDYTPYRPVQWSETPENYIIDSGEYFFFDATIRIEHTHQRRITEHPIQTGANITDHSFQLPARITMEIGMSDVMDNYVSGQWGNSDVIGLSRAKNAYEKLREWQQEGVPLTLGTRFEEYENMVVENMYVPDDFTSHFGMRCTVHFRQIITAEVAIEKASVDPQKTDSSNTGPKAVTTTSQQKESLLYGVTHQ